MGDGNFLYAWLAKKFDFLTLNLTSSFSLLTCHSLSFFSVFYLFAYYFS